MIRMLIITAAFLTVTVVLLILQPGGSDAPNDIATGHVARSEVGLLDITATDPEPLPEPIPEAEVTTVQDASETDSSLQDLTSQVLARLDNADLTDGPVLLPGELRAQIVQAIGEDRSDAYIEALLKQAIELGENDVPTALITRRGRLDTTALLLQLEQRDQARAAIVAVVPQANDSATADRTYVVRNGDSLAAIARDFYGETSAYTVIFNANRDLLGKPDDIRPGQTLVIPDL